MMLSIVATEVEQRIRFVPPSETEPGGGTFIGGYLDTFVARLEALGSVKVRLEHEWIL